VATSHYLVSLALSAHGSLQGHGVLTGLTSCCATVITLTVITQDCAEVRSDTYTVATYERNPKNSADCYMVEAFHCDAAGSAADAFKSVTWQRNPDPTLLLRTYTLASSFLYEEVRVVSTTNCCLHADLSKPS
jgi:hypothetical protein